MSVRTMARVWEMSSHGGTELLMLLALADFSDDDGFCYPSVATLATKCRTTSRHANRLISGLVESGEIEVHEGAGPAVRGGHLNKYRIRIEAKTGAKEMTDSSGLSGVTDMSALTSKAERGDVAVLKGVTCTSVKPSVNHQEPLLTNFPQPHGIEAKDSRPKKKQSLPENFEPNATGKSLIESNGLNLSDELDAFKNHHAARGSLMVDWQAAFRTWIGNAVKFKANGKRTTVNRHTGFDQPGYYGDAQDGIPA